MTHAKFGLSRMSPADDRSDDPHGTAGAAKRWRKAGVRLGGAAAMVVVLSAAAPSDGARPDGTIQGTDAALTRLAPGIGAFTYWLNGPGGEVVTLVRVPRNGSDDAQPKDRDLVFRFSVVLVPGQTQTISVPGIDWGKPPTIQIRRVGETIEVTSSNTNPAQVHSAEDGKSASQPATNSKGG